MKKLIILSHCIVAKGKVAERGSVYPTDDDSEIYTLIAAGRALDLATKEGQAAQEELEAELDEAKAAAAASAKAPVPPKGGK